MRLGERQRAYMLIQFWGSCDLDDGGEAGVGVDSVADLGGEANEW